MSTVRVIGIDPGPVPGLVSIVLSDSPVIDVVQCTHRVAPDVLRFMLAQTDLPTLVQIERFVVGRGSMKAGTAGTITRDLVGQLVEVTNVHREVVAETTLFQRSAAAVKPWATDTRLEAAGLDHHVKGMRHAKDAARHAMFCAVHEKHAADPLLRRWAR